MSIFKEKDAIIKAAFQNIFQSDSESESECDRTAREHVESTHDDQEPGHEEQERVEEVGSPQKSNHVDSLIELDNELDDDEDIQISGQTEDCPVSTPASLPRETSVEVIDVSLDNETPIEAPTYRRGVLTRSQRKRINSSHSVITISDDDDDVVATSTTTPITIDNRRTTPNPHPPSCQPGATKSPANKLDDQEDHDFNLKIIVAGSLKLFRIKYSTKINDALKDMINDLKRENKCLIVTFNDKVVPMDESPDSLKLTPGNILKAIVTTDSTRDSSKRPGEITVKVQDGHRKHTMEFNILQNEPMLELKSLYAKHFKINNTDKIKLFFDGDMVEENLTPEELDIEDDCVLDVMISG